MYIASFDSWPSICVSFVKSLDQSVYICTSPADLVPGEVHQEGEDV